jgi:hypothetical protein
MPDLERIAATQIADALAGRVVGEPLPIDSSSDLCATLEFLVPAVLRMRHPEWAKESIDGFFLSSATKSFDDSAEIAGTCILITDQTVTPFLLDIAPGPSETLQSFRIRLGEHGDGPLLISGPKCNSNAAREMLQDLNVRLDQVEWVYDVSL